MIGDNVDTGYLQALGSRFGRICEADISSGSVVPERHAPQTHNYRTRWYLSRPVVRRQLRLSAKRHLDRLPHDVPSMIKWFESYAAM